MLSGYVPRPPAPAGPPKGPPLGQPYGSDKLHQASLGNPAAPAAPDAIGRAMARGDANRKNFHSVIPSVKPVAPPGAIQPSDRTMGRLMGGAPKYRA